MTTTEWIAVDWGTSHLRAWVMGSASRPSDTDGKDVLQSLHSTDGMGSLAPDQFEAALLNLIAPYLAPNGKTPVLCCGMVGAAQGWQEAPYAATPCPPLSAKTAINAPAADPRLDVWILPGLKQLSPADVMRGEETQVAGFLAQTPDFEGTICLPGTHSKWVSISRGAITRFRTVMTGEVFALLTGHSVLRHSTGSAVATGWSDAAFADGVALGSEFPDQMIADLFSLRADMLLHGPPPDALRAKLSGCLLGYELQAMRPFWDQTDTVLIGAPTLCQHYASALSQLGGAASLTDGSALTLNGLRQAYLNLKEAEHV